MQDQEILRLYKINFDFHWAWTGKDDILQMGANLHVQNQEMLQLYKMNFDFHLAKTGKDDIMHKGANLHNCMCKIRKILQL